MCGLNKQDISYQLIRFSGVGLILNSVQSQASCFPLIYAKLSFLTPGASAIANAFETWEFLLEGLQMRISQNIKLFLLVTPLVFGEVWHSTLREQRAEETYYNILLAVLHHLLVCNPALLEYNCCTKETWFANSYKTAFNSTNMSEGIMFTSKQAS